MRGGDKIAAVISEPILRLAAYRAAEGILKGVRIAISTALHFDEVVTGIGQTGTMIACQYEDVTPDILVTEKGLPAAMFLARPYSAARRSARR